MSLRAITIHSSQGMTIDLGKDVFAFGQAYTGLSCAKSLDSVKVTSVLARRVQLLKSF